MWHTISIRYMIKEENQENGRLRIGQKSMSMKRTDFERKIVNLVFDILTLLSEYSY